MAKVAININQGQYKKLKDQIELEFGVGTPLLSVTYYIDQTAYWKRTNFGIRLSENDYFDLIYPNKDNPTGSRFEHNWFALTEVDSFVEEQTENFLVFFNKPTLPELNPDTEGLLVDKRREVIWNEIDRKWYIDGVEVIFP